MTPDQEARFWPKVDKDAPNGCWVWTAATSKDGYGAFKADGKVVQSHRLSFEHFHRPLEPGELVCHTCDNPPCVNPEHLWAGSARDNVLDAKRKGRLYVPEFIKERYRRQRNEEFQQRLDAYEKWY